MENVRVINIMHNINTGISLNLEHYHRIFGDDYYLERAQIRNGRNVYLFCRGIIRILEAVSEPEAQVVRQVLVQKLYLLEATPPQISNLVVTSLLKMSLCWTLIVASNTKTRFMILNSFL